MKRYSIHNKKGFTLVEIVVVLTIILILISISLAAFFSARKQNELSTEIDKLSFAIEQARATALNGKGSGGVGIKFSSSTYEIFIGNTYSSGPNNKIATVTLPYYISTTLPSPDYNVVFSRLSGIPNRTGTVSIYDSRDISRLKTISIGAQGDIGVIQ